VRLKLIKINTKESKGPIMMIKKKTIEHISKGRHYLTLKKAAITFS